MTIEDLAKLMAESFMGGYRSAKEDMLNIVSGIDEAELERHFIRKFIESYPLKDVVTEEAKTK